MMIEVRQLIKRYGQFTAVDGVSFQVDRGEVLGFLGPNGAGKSTTMRVISGYLPADGGAVSVGGFDVMAEPTAAKELIGYLPEGAPLYDEMKVQDFLAFIGGLRGLRGRSRRHAVERVLDVCALKPVRRQPIGTLSKGYRRRVCFAQSLIHDPQVLIMDEPTDGLDPNQKHEMRNLIKHLGERKAVILSTHILEEVDAACSRVIIIDRGRLIFDGLPEALRAKAATRGAVTVTVLGVKREDAVGAFAELANVAEVKFLEAGGNRVRLQVLPQGRGEDLPAAVGAVSRERRWQLAELRVDEGRLDEVFRQLTAPKSRDDFATAFTTWDLEQGG